MGMIRRWVVRPEATRADLRVMLSTTMRPLCGDWRARCSVQSCVLFRARAFAPCAQHLQATRPRPL